MNESKGQEKEDKIKKEMTNISTFSTEYALDERLDDSILKNYKENNQGNRIDFAFG